MRQQKKSHQQKKSRQQRKVAPAKKVAPVKKVVSAKKSRAKGKKVFVRMKKRIHPQYEAVYTRV